MTSNKVGVFKLFLSPRYCWRPCTEVQISRSHTFTEVSLGHSEEAYEDGAYLEGTLDEEG